MATSGVIRTVESTAAEGDSQSSYAKSTHRHFSFPEWLQTRDCSIRPPIESIAQPSSDSSELSQHHDKRMPGRSFKGQHRAQSAISKQQPANVRERNVSAHNISKTVSISSSGQGVLQEKFSELPSRSSTNTKQGVAKSKIPIRISETTLSSSKQIGSVASKSFSSFLIDKQVKSCSKISKIPSPIAACHSILPKQNATIENSTHVTHDQENRKSVDSGANHADDQALLVVSDHNDWDKKYIMPEEITANVIHVDTTQLNMVETKEEETKTDVSSPATVQLNLTETSIEEKPKTDANCSATSQFAVRKIRGKVEMKSDIIRTATYQLNMVEEGGKTDVTRAKISQFDAVKMTDDEKTKTPFSTNSYDQDLSLVNRQRDDCNSKLRLKYKKKTGINEFQKNDRMGLDQYLLSNDSLITLMQKQRELKAYYSNFPNIDDTTNETSSDIRKAKEFTKSILSNVPSGDINDKNTMCHVLNKLLANDDHECLFYDSENGVNLHDASVNLADINSQCRPFVLTLNSSEGLGNVNNKQDDLELVQILTNVIEQKQSHFVIDDIIKRLSKAHGVNKECIVIKHVYVGTFNIVYTVLDIPSSIIKSLTELYRNLKIQFEQFVCAKIHPLLFRSSFDISHFDHRGNKSYLIKSKAYEVGPPGRTQLYTTPFGWTRYGLKVLDKYSNNNWLHPFHDPGNWYRAFHGTGRAQSQDFDDKNSLFNKQYAPVDALSSIYLNDFRKARIHHYGEGVYCSPNPKFPEEQYVSPVPIDTVQGKKHFKCMLQVAVNPDGVTFTKKDDIWFVPDPKDIRPYGILIKDA